MNGGVTNPQHLHWVNPRTGTYLMAIGGNYNAVGFNDGITCPGYKATFVGNWQLWGVGMFGVTPPVMRLSFSGG